MNYNRLKKVIEERDLTIDKACRLAGITSQQLWTYQQNNSMKVATLEKLCQVLKVSPSIILEPDDMPLSNVPIVNYVAEPATGYDEAMHERLKSLEAQTNSYTSEIASLKETIATQKELIDLYKKK